MKRWLFLIVINLPKTLVIAQARSLQSEPPIAPHRCGKGLASLHNHLIDVDFIIGMNISKLGNSSEGTNRHFLLLITFAGTP